MLTSTQIRQSFLDFFREKKHTIVRSSPLDYKSRDGARIFTNAGMNQFVPIFLGEQKADVDTWGDVIAKGLPTRAADTQKCIRATGKHNDLDDVGLDTYHHTFFEMLGNWSFGDYFKKEAIEWAWELIVERFKFPPNRVYATIYQPDKSKGDPSERDQEAWDLWAERGALVNKGTAECIEIWNLVFIQFNANPDGTFTPLPARHVDTGMGFERLCSIIQGTKGFTDFANAKISNYETDIFRPIFDELEKMSGKTYRSTLPGGQKEPNCVSPAFCGPNTPDGGPQTPGAEPKTAAAGPQIPGVGPHTPEDGPLTSESRVFTPNTGPETSATGPHSPTGGPQNLAGERQSLAGKPQNLANDQIALDVAFRVIADHIRTLSFAIADGIQPGNNDRNYVLRRILRRAVRYGRTLGFHEPFFYKLVAVLARTMGDVFPEIRAKQKHIEEVLRREEEAFNKTLIQKFRERQPSSSTIPTASRST